MFYLIYHCGFGLDKLNNNKVAGADDLPIAVLVLFFSTVDFDC